MIVIFSNVYPDNLRAIIVVYSVVLTLESVVESYSVTIQITQL